MEKIGIILVLLLAYIFIYVIITTISESILFNHGKCRKCGKKLDFDRYMYGSARVYACNNGCKSDDSDMCRHFIVLQHCKCVDGKFLKKEKRK